MLTNHRGILIFVTAAGFVFFPLQYIFTVIKPQPPGGYDLFGSGDIYTVSSIMFLFAMNAVLPVIMALLSNSYMHSKKASDFYHSLPVSRTRLLVADNVAGLTVTLTDGSIYEVHEYEYQFFPNAPKTMENENPKIG